MTRKCHFTSFLLYRKSVFYKTNNRGSIDWIESGCKPTKKLRHENLGDLRIGEVVLHREVMVYWIPGKSNPADIFTKEDNDVGHYQSLRDTQDSSSNTKSKN